MKLNGLMIGTKMRLGLGTILLLVVALGVLAWIQADRLWFTTKDLYEHPYQVRRALDTVTLEILAMRQDMAELVRVESDQERVALLQSIDTHEVAAAREFAIIYDRYLGPKIDITESEHEFIQWKAIREETCRLLREGKNVEAYNRIRANGVESLQVEKIMREIMDVSIFAKNRGEAFYDSALAQKNTINLQLAGVALFILLLFLFASWRLVRLVKAPLAALTTAADAFRQGNLETRCGYDVADEFGELSALFNTMAETIQTEMNLNKHAIHLSDVMLREEEAHAFCRELLKGLMEHTGSQVGAVFLLNEAKTMFEHFESIGLGSGGRTPFSATALEGEFGAALATRQIQRIIDIPSDSRFSFTAVTGLFQPREILTIPIFSDHSVSAVFSLASVRAYDVPSVRLVHSIWNTLVARVNGVLAFQKITALAAKLEEQNRELDAQRRELVLQSSAVTAQNAELEMQKKQLDEANRLKSAFLSNMSHELRTPLNSVIALSGVLSRRLSTTISAEERNYLEIIERNGKSLLTLINNILDLSRIEAGRERLIVSTCAVHELVGELVSMIKPQATEKKIALLNQIPTNLPLITTDPDKLKHILQNIIGNAVKFTEQGQVTIVAVVEGAEMVIHVSDTGIGISADHIPLIFDEFRQGDDSTSRKYGGTGLGLAIAKKYIQLIGGTIQVDSIPGQGTIFTIRLPLALALSGDFEEHDPGQFSRKRLTGYIPLPSGLGHVILVVEDNESAIIQLSDILLSKGYRVQVAHNGQEALVQIEQTLPDAMILDLMMPEVDGFEVLKAIRGMERTAHLPVLILTAKHVTPDELSFLKGNHIHQLIQKGNINKDCLLSEVAQMVAPPEVQPALSQQRRRSVLRSGKPLVLIIEDNLDNLKTARALLADDYEILEAMDGETALKLAQKHRPDIILSDIALPGMDGIAVLAAIRKDESLRTTPVIAVTASAMKGDRETILAYGFDGYISKPIHAEMMIKALREVLD